MKNKNSLTDYCAYILLKILGPLVRAMPLSLSFFAGRIMGDLCYLFDLKHRAIAYANLKIAFGGKFSPAKLRGIVRKFYRAFGQNIIEVFYIPEFDKKYLERYVVIEGYQNVLEGFQKGKGVIFAVMHAGSWELGNIICANLGFAFSMFVRGQNFPRVEKILNSYRGSQGCRFIQRENELRELVRVLKANESAALTIDQGGKNGVAVKFFNKSASMASGAVRLALKLDCALIPVFPIRVKGPKIKFYVEPVFKLKTTGNPENDVRNNLQELVKVFEKRIIEHPQEYLWTYKSWKYSREKNILILADGKTGHLRQAQALAKIAAEHLWSKGITAEVNIVDVKFKNKLSSRTLILTNPCAGKYICPGCMLCLRFFLAPESYARLIKIKPDVIISCGSSLAAVNYLLSKENQAKSLVIMRPSVFSARRFDLVIMAKHDRPQRAKNIAVIDGALNLVEPDYLKEQSRQFIRETGLSFSAEQFGIGVLLGGDSKNFQLQEAAVQEALQQLKDFCVKFNARILLTTSRRTSEAVESLVKKELIGFERARIIIAREKNYLSAVPGILALSRVVVVSCESISMISEAVNSLKYVLVIKSGKMSARRRLFLDNLSRGNYICLAEPADIGKALEKIFTLLDSKHLSGFAKPPENKPLRDNQAVLGLLRRII